MVILWFLTVKAAQSQLCAPKSLFLVSSPLGSGTSPFLLWVIGMTALLQCSSWIPYPVHIFVMNPISNNPLQMSLTMPSVHCWDPD